MTTKPLEEDPEAALEVLREARRRGLALHLNSPAPVPSPDLAVIADWRVRHDLGRPVSAFAETYASYREQADGTWMDDPRHCPAAPLYRLGIYAINDLTELFGPAAQVQVQSSRLFTGRPTADNAQVGIRFENGALATVAASFAVSDGDHYRNSMTVHFERGTILRNVGPERGEAAGSLALIAGDGTRRRAVVERCEVAALSGSYRWDLLHRAVLGDATADERTPESIVAGLGIIEAIRRAEQGSGVAEVRPCARVAAG